MKKIIHAALLIGYILTFTITTPQHITPTKTKPEGAKVNLHF